MTALIVIINAREVRNAAKHRQCLKRWPPLQFFGTYPWVSVEPGLFLRFLGTFKYLENSLANGMSAWDYIYKEQSQNKEQEQLTEHLLKSESPDLGALSTFTVKEEQTSGLNFFESSIGPWKPKICQTRLSILKENQWMKRRTTQWNKSSLSMLMNNSMRVKVISS